MARSSSEFAFQCAIAKGYCDLAAAIVLEAVVEVKSNVPPHGARDMPAFPFLLSDWGCYLAEAGANIPSSVMRKLATGWEADTHRFWCYGGDGLGMTCALEPALEDAIEYELYREWTASNGEQRRYKAMVRDRKREQKRKGVIDGEGG